MGKPILRGLILVVAGLILFSWTSAQAGPKIEIPDASRELGQVIGGSLISQEFTVFNRGDAELVISKMDND